MDIWVFKTKGDCRRDKTDENIRKNICAYLLSVYNIINLSYHEQVLVMKVRFKR